MSLLGYDKGVRNQIIIERGSEMDFSTKAKEAMSRVVAEEMSRLIEAEEIKDIEGLENSLRKMLMEV